MLGFHSALAHFFRYNNKTYRIDDIAWDHTPNNTFKRGDADISFKNYYKTVGVMYCIISIGVTGTIIDINRLDSTHAHTQ